MVSEPLKRIASAWDEVQLDSITQPPTDLKELPIDDAVEIIREWFLDNFEDPAEHTPRDDGDFVYIWGGPYDAEEIIRELIGDEATEEQLDAAINRIQQYGIDWAPNEMRIQPPEEEEGAEHESVEALHARMLEEISTVEGDLTALETPGIGHNHPPEAIAQLPFTPEEREDLIKALQILKGQPTEPPEAEWPVLRDAEARVQSVAAKIGAYIAKQADTFVTEATKAAGKAAGVALVGGVGWWLSGLHIHLQELLHTLGNWLTMVSLPF